MILEDAVEREFTDRLAKGSQAWKYRWIRLLPITESHPRQRSGFPRSLVSVPRSRRSCSPFLMKSAFVQTASIKPTPGKTIRSIIQACSLLRNELFRRITRTVTPVEVFLNGVGYNFGYRFAKYAYLDAQMNWFPGFGSTGQKWFGRGAGFIRRQGWPPLAFLGRLCPRFARDSCIIPRRWRPGSESDYASTTRFAGDVSGAIEYYAAKHSMVQFTVGTTLIHYLTSHPDPNQRPTTVLSDQYYYLQGNFHVALGYQFGI